jgi:uncharacterized low-complexity protein
MNKKLIASGITVASLLVMGANTHAKLFKMEKAGGNMTFAGDEGAKCGADGKCGEGKCDDEKKKEGDGKCGEGSCSDEKKEEVKK